MERRKFHSGRLYLLSFAIGTVVFALVFAMSYSIAYFQSYRVSHMQANFAYDVFAHKLDHSLFDKGCDNESFEKVSDGLYFHGRVIGDLEKRLGKNNEDVLSGKKFYSLIELEHFEFVNVLNEECNSGLKTILFFYSNENADVEKSEKLGRMLSVVSNRNDDLYVYSFDVNLGTELIEDLKKHYGVEGPQTVVINGEIVLEDPQNLDEIEKRLG